LTGLPQDYNIVEKILKSISASSKEEFPDESYFYDFVNARICYIVSGGVYYSRQQH